MEAVHQASETWIFGKINELLRGWALDLIDRDLCGKREGRELYEILKVISNNVCDNVLEVRYFFDSFKRLTTIPVCYRDVPKWVIDFVASDEVYWKVVIKRSKFSVLLYICEEEKLDKETYSVLEKYVKQFDEFIIEESRKGNSMKTVKREYEAAISSLKNPHKDFTPTDNFTKFCFQIKLITKELKKRNKNLYDEISEKNNFLLEIIRIKIDELLFYVITPYFNNKGIAVDTLLMNGLLLEILVEKNKKDSNKIIDKAVFHFNEDSSLVLVRKNLKVKKARKVMDKYIRWRSYLKEDQESKNIMIIQEHLQGKAAFFGDNDNYYDYNKLSGLWVLSPQKYLYDIIPLLFEEIYKALLLSSKRNKPSHDEETLREKESRECHDIYYYNKLKKCTLAGWKSTITRFRNKRDIVDRDFEAKLNSITYLFAIARKQVADLKTGQLSPLRKRHYFSKASTVTGIGSAEEFEVIMRAIHPDDSVREYMQRSMGSVLNGEIPNRRVDVWIGEGANGKSVLSNMLLAISPFTTSLPASAVAGPKNGQEGQKNAHTSHLNVLQGNRCAITCEIKQNRVLEEDIIKKISCGDRLDIRKLGKEQEQIVSRCKIIIHTNNIPSYEAVKSLTDRLRYIEFIRRFVANPTEPNELKLDENLTVNIIDNLNNPFAWLLIGSVSFYRIGDAPPPAIVASSKVRHNESDFLISFLEETLEKSPGNTIPIGKIIEKVARADPSYKGILAKKFTPHLRRFANNKDAVVWSHNATVLKGYKFIEIESSTSTLGDL